MAKESKEGQEQEVQQKSDGQAKKWSGKTIAIILGAVVAAAALAVGGVFLYRMVHYADRWYENTYVNGMDVSNQTLEESKANLEAQFADYTLTVTGREDGLLEIDGDAIDFSFQLHEELDSLFEQQHASVRFFSQKNDWQTKFEVNYDEEKLTELVKQSELVAGSSEYTVSAPESAKVIYSTAQKKYVCKQEKVGNKLNQEKLLQAIADAMAEGKTEIDLTDQTEYPDVYKAPKYTSDSEKIKEELTLCNQAAVRYIVWNMGKGNVEQITPEEISEWISVKNGKIKYDNEKIEEWVEAFCLKYKTVGITRTIKNHKGKKVKVAGGDYGWQLDYEKMVKQAKKALKAEIDADDVQAYIDDPSDETKKAITLRRKAVYLNTAYQKDYVHFKNDWDKKNYIEVSLKEQKIYVIRNGKVKFSCRTISGKPVDGRSTPTGTYYIKEHKANNVLRGEDYETPVQNWVRITWTGTGFHSATWQNWSAWTKKSYITHGSHGCLNLSLSDSKKIFDLTKYREAVFIY